MNGVVITGPTGAIGIALIEKCIAEKIKVLAICRKGSCRIDRIPKSSFVKILECDLNQLNSLQYVTDDKFDVFYHFAWAATIGQDRNNMQLQLDNIKYSLDAVQLAKRLGCHTFVGAGSQAEYGRYEGKLNSMVPTFPENGYGMAKLCAGQMTRVECQQQGIRHIWTRILSVYGPYDSEQTMISKTIKALLNGEKPSVTLGEQKWDYLYSGDAASAMLLLGEKGKDGKIYCVGSGNVLPLRQYIEMIRDRVDGELEIGFGDIPYGDKQVMYLCADISQLAEDTGFKVETSFDLGIKNTIEWIKRGRK